MRCENHPYRPAEGLFLIHYSGARQVLCSKCVDHARRDFGKVEQIEVPWWPDEETQPCG